MTSLRLAARRKTGDFTVDVALDAEPGITILFGPSGAGKSTTLSMIAGLVKPDEGSVKLGDAVWFDGAAGIDVPIEQRRVGYVFQSLALFPHLTALDNVAYGVPKGVAKAASRERCLSMLERFRVAHLEKRKPRTFSGGEAQRVALARAFAMSPAILLLDEPFSALDRTLRRELHVDLRSMVDAHSLPTILITHHQNEARALGDQLVMIRDGRVEARGTPGEVLTAKPSQSERPIAASPPRSLDFDDTPMATPEALS